MKNQKGVTLIALIVSIIVMLILVYATITLVYQGELITKAGDARDLTNAKAEEETNVVDEAGWKTLETIIDPETFEQAQTYSKIYINPEPKSVLELNPEILKLFVEEGDGGKYLYFEGSSDEYERIVIRLALEQRDELNQIVQPQSIMLNFEIDKDTPETTYMYLFSQQDVDWAEEALELDFELGWNNIVLSEDGTPISNTPVSYSEIPSTTNLQFSGTNFSSIQQYLGYYFRSEKW
jgi:competence protein ComGC